MENPTNYYFLWTNGYKVFSKLIKKYGTEDDIMSFDKLCEYAIINKPNYIPIILSDDDVAPYLTSKYINRLTEWVRKKVTLGILFNYFGLPIDEIKFSSDEYFNPNKWIIRSMGNIDYLIHPQNLSDDVCNHNKDLNNLLMLNSRVLDVEVDLQSFVSHIDCSSLYNFEYDLESDIKCKEFMEYEKPDINKDSESELYIYKTIAYTIYENICWLNSLKNENPEVWEQTNSQLILAQTNLEIKEDLNLVLNLDSKKSNRVLVQEESNINLVLNDIKLYDVVKEPESYLRPTLIIIDEPESNAKIEKIIQLNDTTTSINIIYNYKQESHLDKVDILKKCANLLGNLANTL